MRRRHRPRSPRSGPRAVQADQDGDHEERDAGRNEGEHDQRDHRGRGRDRLRLARAQARREQGEERGGRRGVEAEDLGIGQRARREGTGKGPEVPEGEQGEAGDPERETAFLRLVAGDRHGGVSSITKCEATGRRQPRTSSREDRRRPYSALRMPSRHAVATPAQTPPPAPITPTRANCEAPVNMTSDRKHVCTSDRPDVAEMAPNEIAYAPLATAMPRASRTIPRLASTTRRSWVGRGLPLPSPPPFAGRGEASQWIAAPAGETTHQRAPKLLTACPVASPACLSWTK